MWQRLCKIKLHAPESGVQIQVNTSQWHHKLGCHSDSSPGGNPSKVFLQQFFWNGHLIVSWHFALKINERQIFNSGKIGISMTVSNIYTFKWLALLCLTCYFQVYTYLVLIIYCCCWMPNDTKHVPQHALRWWTNKLQFNCLLWRGSYWW